MPMAKWFSVYGTERFESPHSKICMSEGPKPRTSQKAGKDLAAFNDLQLQQLTCAKDLSRKGYGAISPPQNPVLLQQARSSDNRRMQTRKKLTSLQKRLAQDIRQTIFVM